MKRAAGFTLIELVIVIVILGILGAVAAPRFLNLQGDAYGANLDGIKSSIESASTIANAKAILAGKDKGKSSVEIDDNTTITVTNGYPDEKSTGILAVIDIKAAESADATKTDLPYVYKAESTAGSEKFTVWPTARYNLDCKVEYTPAAENERPEIVITDTAC